MSKWVRDFKDCAHQTAEICGFSDGKIIRTFGLGDFLEIAVKDDDDASTIAVKAIRYFCEGRVPGEDIFKFGVLTVGIFLQACYSKKTEIPATVVLQDLVAILKSKGADAHIRKWIDSNFR